MEIEKLAANFKPLELHNTVYKNEASLFAILAVFASLFWLVLIVGTVGIALLYLLMFFIIYLFTHSAFIAHLRGNAVEITAEQFPDLYRRVQACSDRLGIIKQPKAYLWAADGMLNAFATRFLSRDYIVLTSSVIDALQSKPDGINFYIGHEMGHLRRGHLTKAPFLALVSWMPILGPAYSRACESSCDLHGLRCCDNLESATNALGVLAAGVEQWRQLSIPEYLKQADNARGFWMSLHELTSDYPWLAKRVARVVAASQGQEYRAAGRNPFAYLFALCSPRVYGGGGFGAFFVVVFIIGILAAIALPAYQDYVQRAQMSSEWSDDSYSDDVGAAESAEEYAPANMGDPSQSQIDLVSRYGASSPIKTALQAFYEAHNGEWPQNLDQLSISQEVNDALGGTVEYYGNGEFGYYGTESLGDYQTNPIYIDPTFDENGVFTGWRCYSPVIPDEYLNVDCQG